MLIIFDLGGVLFRRNDVIPDVAALFGVDPTAFISALRKPFDALCTGKISPAAFWVVARETFGVTVADDPWETLYQPEVDECVVETISHLRGAGYRVVAGSNTMDSHYRHHIEHGQLDVFDAVYVSHRMGYVKPDPAFYRFILAGEGRRPDEVLFVDDREENVVAARRVGMEAVRFTGCGDLRRYLYDRIDFDIEKA